MAKHKFQKWQVGEATITKVVEMQVAGGTRFLLPDATAEAVKEIEWLQPHFADESGKLIMSVHALIIEINDQRIIVDTCIGNDKPRNIPAWNMLQLPFLDDLATAGFDRHTIDTVLCTHLHVDHVGWNTMRQEDAWVPTFPNAKYLIAKPEFSYWQDQDEGEFGDIFSDSVKPVFDAGLVQLVGLDHRLSDSISLQPSLGHSPGHVSIKIESKGQSAIITGDCVHHPCQMNRNDWSSTADYDAKQAMKTRTDLFESLADTECLVIGTHFATPTAGLLKRDGEAYWLNVEIGDQFNYSESD